MGDGEGPHGVEALAEVRVPQLVRSRERLEGALVDHRALLEGGAGAGDEVAPPPLKLEGLPEDLLLVREVVLGRVQIRGDPRSRRRQRRRDHHWWSRGARRRTLAPTLTPRSEEEDDETKP